jgi:arsenate reductase (glutaredoxin)
MLKIYHNPRCKKSCEGLKYLQDKNIDYEVVRYLESGLTIEILNEILLKMNKKPFDLVRTQEEFYKKELKGMQFNDTEWEKIIIENPKLLQRPIVIGKYKAVLAQPVTKIDELLK